MSLITQLNNLPKYPDAGTPFCDRVEVSVDHHGNFWLAREGSNGEEFGYHYSTFEELVQRWNIVIDSYDEQTGFWGGRTVEPEKLKFSDFCDLHFKKA